MRLLSNNFNKQPIVLINNIKYIKKIVDKLKKKNSKLLILNDIKMSLKK